MMHRGITAPVALALVASALVGCSGQSPSAPLPPLEPPVPASEPAAPPAPAPEPEPAESPPAAAEPAPSPSPDGVDLAGLLTAPVPSLCDHPPGTLSAGRLAGIPQGDGGVELPDSTVEDILAGAETTRLAAVGPSETGEPQVAAVLQCDRGGVGWPDAIVLWTRDFQLLGGFALDGLTGGGRESAEFVESAPEGGFRVGWRTTLDTDAMCCGLGSAEAVFAWRAGAVSASEVALHDGSDEVAELIRLVREGQEVPASLATRDAVDGLREVFSDGLLVRDNDVRCGEPLPWDLPQDAPALGPIPCVTTIGNDGGFVVFAVSPGEWNEYTVTEAYSPPIALTGAGPLPPRS
ncbi:hypothetical protein [Naasia sp. SYSU D00057]|uniref:hypothetical protein n=1 Tax=Naasia sp. SYSU D00057 TaxID=2817380 RepID=UPI001B3068DC|nr:hypothetical protein [Naasia sp. SYSU D00057]